MTAAGRITSARVTVGDRIHVDNADTRPGIPAGVVHPTTRKRTPVATVTAVERVAPGRYERNSRIRITTDLGVMIVAPSQTQKLVDVPIGAE